MRSTIVSDFRVSRKSWIVAFQRDSYTQVIKDGEQATLELEVMTRLTAKIKSNLTVEIFFRNILQLFNDQCNITIIGNTSLNSESTYLAPTGCG